MVERSHRLVAAFLGEQTGDLLVGETDLFEGDGGIGEPWERADEFDHRVAGVDDAGQCRVTPSGGQGGELVVHLIGPVGAHHDDVLPHAAQCGAEHAGRCRAVDDQVLFGGVHRFGRGRVVGDDAQ